MEQPKNQGGVIIRTDLTLVAFYEGTAIEIRLSPQEAINFAEALVVTALANTPPGTVLMESEFNQEAGDACQH